MILRKSGRVYFILGGGVAEAPNRIGEKENEILNCIIRAFCNLNYQLFKTEY
jgi:hypothetical protein